MATEEYLLDRLTPDERILYLWQSKGAIVIGKNQNPWKECNMPLIKRDRLKVARRLSGGGTVYQDAGNLNFTFISHRDRYDFYENIDIIISTLQKKNINLTVGKGHKLALQGTKCSGNAFCFRKDKALHHGTLLVNADLGKMRRYLQPFSEQIETHAVNSNIANVVNLSNRDNRFDCKEVMNGVIDHFTNLSADKPEIIENIHLLESDAIQKLYKKYMSWPWIFGNTPKFQIHFRKHFKWGDCRLLCSVDQGRVTHLEITSNNSSKDTTWTSITGQPECRFNSGSIANRIRRDFKCHTQSRALYNLAAWVKGMNF